MRYSRCSVVLSVFPAVFLVTFGGLTHPYIDPGTGSIILQSIIGAFAAALVAIGIFWRQIKAFVKNLFSKSKQHEPPQDQQH